MLHFLKPGQFVRFADKAMPFFIAFSFLLIGGGMYFAIFASPPDYQQGESVRIMYVHVPSAWMSLFIYMIVATAGSSFLIWRNPLSDMIARSSAPIGACFAFLTLVSGSLWGKPIWGAWWVWDARLTSMLILFFLYLGYIALSNAFDDYERGSKASAVFALVGAVNVPIIKFSVDWWNTLHQPASVVKFSGPAIDPSMLLPLLLMAAGFTCYYLVFLAIRVKAEVLSRKITRLQLRNIS